MTHFSYLKPQFPAVFEAAVKAEGAALADPRTAAFWARRAVELAVKWAFKHDSGLRLPYQDNISALIHEPTFINLAGHKILTKSKLVIRIGNQAAHSERQIHQKDAIRALRELTHITYWLARTYGRGGAPDAPRFDEAKLPQAPGKVVAQKARELEALQSRLNEKDEELSKTLADMSQLDDELKRIRAEVAKAKAENAKIKDGHDYNEEETRDAFIDLLLNEAGWPLDEARDREFPVQGMPNNRGEGRVDYVLWGDDGKPLGLVEAKRTKRDARVGQEQARLYADCLESQFGQRPVIFYSNGYEHYIWDDTMHPPRETQGFLKKDELELAIQRRSSREELNADDVNRDIVGRAYQLRAIQKTAERFQRENQRKALLVMATGTGKTRTVIALADLLMRKNWVKRVLFLADRVALVKQAVNAFKAHLPSAAVVNLVQEKDKEGRVYVSTYQTMMGLIDGKGEDAKRFGVGHFDLVVIDEAHRSVYQKYGAIFRYFDSYLIGLTATPTDEIDRNTYSLFDLESGVPTDAYPLDQAIEEGFLVPPRPKSFPMKFQREGIKYDDLSEAEKEQWDAIEWSDDGGESPDEVSATAINNWLFNEDTVDLVLKSLMEEGIKVAGGDRLGKTIIFAKNQLHAEFIRERFDKNFPHYKGDFARVITFKTEYAQNVIDRFSVADSTPHIAISVDMLDTGIDIPEIVNLVFFKLVHSKTKFWQMIGRGTRLCEDLFGPGSDKTEFKILDYCGNIEFFAMNAGDKDGSSPMTLTQRLFQLKMELIQSLDGRERIKEPDTLTEALDFEGEVPDEAAIRKETAEELLTIIGNMDMGSFMVREKRKHVEKYVKREAWERIDNAMIDEVVDHIAPLPSAVSDPDEMAKRFDLLCLNLQLSVMRGRDGFDKLKDKVIKIAEKLLEKQEVPGIKAQLPLIMRIAEEEYWQGITVPMLELVRRRIRGLVQFIDTGERNIVYTDFEDEMGEGKSVDITAAPGQSLDRFREKARAFLRAHLNHVSLNKLRMNKPLTASDLQELERLFMEAGIGEKDMLDRAVEESNGLGKFVRSLVGLDKVAAQEAFAAFTEGKRLNADQMEFIGLIIEHLTERGIVPAEALYESPFTAPAPQGPDGLFPREDVEKIIKVLVKIEDNAKTLAAG